METAWPLCRSGNSGISPYISLSLVCSSFDPLLYVVIATTTPSAPHRKKGVVVQWAGMLAAEIILTNTFATNTGKVGISIG